jgi:iron(III) transport system ATP-binding protein
VTHDSEEAMFMGDRIALMREGRVLQLDTPEALYFAPTDRYVATFLGEVNRLPSRVQAGRAATAFGTLDAPGLPEGMAVEVLVRPEGLRLGAEGAPEAEVEACRLLGATTMVHLSVPDGTGALLHLHARLPPGRRLSRGERVTVAIDPERAFVFPPEAS